MTQPNRTKTQILTKGLCEHCHRAVTRRETAAAIQKGNIRYVWCFDCWDGTAEAVEEYRRLGL